MQIIKPLIGGLLLVSAAYAATLAHRNCWTCSPGFVHWFDAGLPEPWDKCACVPGTKKPQVPAPPARNCWSCAPGYQHWWTIPGYKEPTDKCACVYKQSAPVPVPPAPKPVGCWTCAPNYVHWFEIPGYKEPADKCACVYKQSAPVPVPPAPKPVGCWTCAPNYVHWFEIPGYKEPADKCACVYKQSAPVPVPPAPKPVGCWTCAPGYTHWFNIPGYKEPTDKCACVANSQVTTTKPAAPTPKPPAPAPKPVGCWTCAPGYIHWFDIPGYLEPTDKCACVAKSTTPTAAPGSPPAAPAPIGSGPYAGLTGKMGTFIRAMTASNGNTGSISFGSAVAPYSPWNPPPLSLVGQLLDILKSTTKFRTIMMYHIDSYTVPLVAQRGFKMLGIISINVGQDNSGMINEAIKAIRAYPDTIVAVSCGNELGHTAGLTSAVVSAVGQCVRQLKSAGISQPIGNIDTYYSWCNKNERECNNPWSAMANQVDWIGLNDYAYFSNIYSGIWPCTPPNRAAQQTMENHQRVMRLYQNKPVVLTETGWPTAPSGTTIMNTPNYVTGQQCGPANDANQKATVQSLINLYRSKQYPMNLFSAFKEAWKGATSQHIETQWGICDGTYPYTCKNQPN